MSELAHHMSEPEKADSGPPAALRAAGSHVTPKYAVRDIRVADILIDSKFENIRLDRNPSDDPGGATTYKEKLKALAQDINDHGLFHPLTVREQPVEDSTAYLLRAGFRRFRAILLLEWEEVQASIIPANAPAELDYWINIQENLEREDLGAYEVAEAALRMQRLFGRSGADFARETKRSISYVNNILRWRRMLPQPILDDWRKSQPLLTQEKLEKLSHMNEDEALALWQAEKGETTIAVLAGPHPRGLQPEDKDKKRSPRRPNMKRLIALHAAIQMTDSIKDPGVRELAAQLVRFCQGAQRTIPGIYPTSRHNTRSRETEVSHEEPGTPTPEGKISLASLHDTPEKKDGTHEPEPPPQSPDFGDDPE